MTLREFPDWTWAHGVYTREISNLHLEVKWQRDYRYTVTARSEDWNRGRLLDEGTRPSLRQAIEAAERVAASRQEMWGDMAAGVAENA